jgi:hypothetical protein
MVDRKGAHFLPASVSDPLKTDWQRYVLASSGYLELGMFDDAAMVLEEIAPEDKTRNEVLGARINFTWQPKSGIWPRRLPATW